MQESQFCFGCAVINTEVIKPTDNLISPKEYAIYNTRRLKTPSEDEIVGELPTIKE